MIGSSCNNAVMHFWYLLCHCYNRSLVEIFQAGCHKRRLTLGYNLSWFIFCCFFVFHDLYFADLVSIGIVLC